MCSTFLNEDNHLLQLMTTQVVVDEVWYLELQNLKLGETPLSLRKVFCFTTCFLLGSIQISTKEENLKRICSSCYDGPHRGTVALLGDQAGETHRISYNSELNLPIVLRWTHRSTMAC
ncbi:glycerol-3-phosphate acyltransferase [Trifolium repens]|nr:glycerol-3-phosphate acyltransferase [Trifolium repens]